MENKKRILLVDDEATITRTLRLYLEGTGKYEVRTQNHGTEAVATARAFKPDVVLLDIVMPDIDGAEVAEKMKGDPALKNVPVVFLTALVRPGEVAASGSDIGGYPFIAKPLDPDKIIECIEKYTA
jgi:CheY-like chemotaxis protein